MALRRKRGGPATGSPSIYQEKYQEKDPERRALTRAWILFFVIGLPAAFMAALAPLTSVGIHIELLRPLWQPWPPDILKPVLGVVGFVATFAYLCYRIGRIAGYRWGVVAQQAAARNVEEGRSLAREQARP